jgi:cation diffusion facilitator CzcD-associated flavoprotein CzcO
MATRTDLLVIGAGPYAYSAAAFARDNGIDTHVVGQPMAFWREHMPADMYLRSGPDWHLDGSTALAADYVVFASGYRGDLARVPYLAGVLEQVSVTDGFPT